VCNGELDEPPGVGEEANGREVAQGCLWWLIGGQSAPPTCSNGCSLRRRVKFIPNAFGEPAVLKLMFGALTT
jgi:hypothetical protein